MISCFARFFLGRGRLRRVILVLLVVAPGNRREEQAPRRREERHFRKVGVRVRRRRDVFEIRLEAELLEWLVGNVEPFRAAELLLAIDVVDVAMVFLDDGMRFREQFVAAAERQRPGRARADAGGRVAVFEARGAELALRDERQRLTGSAESRTGMPACSSGSRRRVPGCRRRHASQDRRAALSRSTPTRTTVRGSACTAS